MARGIEGNEIATPKPPPQLKKSASSVSQSSKQQKSILGFFQKKGGAASSPSAPSTVKPSPSAPSTVKQSPASRVVKPGLTPTTSSDAGVPSSPPLPSSPVAHTNAGRNKENGMPSPATSSLESDADAVGHQEGLETVSSPPRKVWYFVVVFDLLIRDSFAHDFVGKEEDQLRRI